MNQELPKLLTFCDSWANGSQWNRKHILLFKFYIFLSILLSSGCHVFVMLKYTLESNGAIINLSYLIHNLMQFMIIFRPSGYVTTEEVLCPLDQAAQKRIKKSLISSSWFVFAFLVFWCSMLTIHLFSRSTGHVMLFMFGFDTSSLEWTLQYILIFTGINTFIGLLLIAGHLTCYYSILIQALVLFGRQNVALVDTFLSKYDSIHPKELMFSRIEELYLTYRELVEKVNLAYGKVPIWYLIVLYTNIIFTGTFLVIFHGKATTFELLGGSLFGSLLSCICMYSMIYLCDLSHTWMEKFRQKGLHLVNLHLKRSKKWDPKCECLANTLRGLPLLKLKAGQVYDMEPSIVISLIASAIPMTVMMVSLLRQM